jgi:hypothetical protein
VRQFRGRTISFTVSPRWSGIHRPGERNPAEVKNKIVLPWNEAQLNFVSLRSSLHYGGFGGLSRVEMNAQKTAALDSPPNPKRRSVSDFSLDMADDFIEGQQ